MTALTPSELMAEANGLSQTALAERLKAAMPSILEPTIPEQAALIEAAMRFLAITTGDRPLPR